MYVTKVRRVVIGINKIPLLAKFLPVRSIPSVGNEFFSKLT